MSAWPTCIINALREIDGVQDVHSRNQLGVGVWLTIDCIAGRGLNVGRPVVQMQGGKQQHSRARVVQV